MDSPLQGIHHALSHAQDQAQLIRPLLQVLEQATEFESTYLTRIDLERGLQTVLYSHNTQEMQIPEGIEVDWDQTLCKRALDEQRFAVDDVPQRWGGTAADALGIQTYLSAPVRLRDGTVFGTLCAASQSRRALPAHSRQLLELIAQIIAQRIENDRLLQQLQQLNAQLHAAATTDPLTQLPNRRALFEQLQHLADLAQRQHRWLLLGFVDLDGFKTINDTHGHAAGDALLVHIARWLQASLRESDCLGRLGGDEFLVVGLGPERRQPAASTPAAEAPPQDAIAAMRQRLSAATTGTFTHGPLSLHYPGASVGVVAVNPDPHNPGAAVRLADAEMYRIKARRKPSSP